MMKAPTAKLTKLILASLVSSTALSACVPLIVGGVVATTATTASVIADRRDAGVQLTDKTIAHRVEEAVKKNLPTETTHIDALSFNRRVLIVGEVASLADKSRAEQLARGVADVRDVVNQVKVMPVQSFGERSDDAWLSSKVRTELFTTLNVPSRTVDTITSKGVVYLMGEVTPTESANIAKAAAGVSGVKEVVKVFDIIPEESKSSSSSSSSSSNNASSSASSSNNATSSGDAQTFPYQP